MVFFLFNFHVILLYFYDFFFLFFFIVVVIVVMIIIILSWDLCLVPPQGLCHPSFEQNASKLPLAFQNIDVGMFVDLLMLYFWHDYYIICRMLCVS